MSDVSEAMAKIEAHERFGSSRLQKYGDMNTIDDFIGLFPSYKHDEVFLLEYKFVIDRIGRNTIIRNIEEQINQHYVDKSKKV